MYSSNANVALSSILCHDKTHASSCNILLIFRQILWMTLICAFVQYNTSNFIKLGKLQLVETLLDLSHMCAYWLLPLTPPTYPYRPHYWCPKVGQGLKSSSNSEYKGWKSLGGKGGGASITIILYIYIYISTWMQSIVRLAEALAVAQLDALQHNGLPGCETEA